jgi:hypothetical protein
VRRKNRKEKKMKRKETKRNEVRQMSGKSKPKIRSELNCSKSYFGEGSSSTDEGKKSFEMI